jgi:parallel beta helix pectate lyase-like protein
MTVVRTGLRGLAVALICGFVAARAEAQASRTWVSGVGDDANPCSRTAPCKTFAGAISKTAPFGEINAIDPGGFGAVTITKSITIDGEGVLAGILAAGTNGIIINAAASDVVTLRNLDINGFNSGINGIRILSAREVHIENCQIYGFAAGSARGISDERTVGQLFVSDSTIRDNGQFGIGIITASTLTGTLHGTLTNVRLERNGNAGLALSKGSKATVTHSVASANVSFGFYADGNGGASEMNLHESLSAANGQGVASLSGATTRISNMVITGNGVGVNTAGGSLLSYSNNRIDGNGSGNGPATGNLTDQ